MDETYEQSDVDWLVRKSQVQERPFSSSVPIIGRFIAQFRQLWNAVSTQWYVRPLLQQQNEFNRLLVQLIHDQDEWFIALDREQTALSRNTAELSTQLVQMNRLLTSVEERLSRLEAHL